MSLLSKGQSKLLKSALLLTLVIASAVLIPATDGMGQDGTRNRSDDAFGDLDKNLDKQKPQPVQDKPKADAPAPENAGKPAEKAMPFRLGGQLEAFRTFEVKADLEAYDGKLILRYLTSPGAFVEEGQQIAQLEPVELDEKLRRAEEGLERARLLLEMLEIDAEKLRSNREIEMAAAKRTLRDARVDLEEWNKFGKDEALRNARLAVSGQEDSIEDQEDELKQLKELYQSNDLAKESQDIVIKRSERRLERSRESLKTVKAREEMLKSNGLEVRQRDLQLAVERAERNLEQMPSNQERAIMGLEYKISEARSSLHLWERQVHDMQMDVAQRINISASHTGYFFHGALKGNDGVSRQFNPGDEIKRGTLLGTIVDMSVLEVVCDMPFNQRSNYATNEKLTSRAGGGNEPIHASISSIGMLSANNAVKVRVLVTNRDNVLFPGMHIQFDKAPMGDRRRD